MTFFVSEVVSSSSSLRQARQWSARAGALLLLLVLAACDDGMGVCVHEYLDPILEVASVVDAADGEAINRIWISGVERFGEPVPGEALLGGPAYGATPDGEAIRCDPACGIGVGEGEYRLIVTAHGYQPKELTVLAEYQEFRGGCPSSSAGSHVLELELTPVDG
jgi:hypothetical protein